MTQQIHVLIPLSPSHDLNLTKYKVFGCDSKSCEEKKFNWHSNLFFQFMFAQNKTMGLDPVCEC